MTFSFYHSFVINYNISIKSKAPLVRPDLTYYFPDQIWIHQNIIHLSSKICQNIITKTWLSILSIKNIDHFLLRKLSQTKLKRKKVEKLVWYQKSRTHEKARRMVKFVHLRKSPRKSPSTRPKPSHPATRRYMFYETRT